MALERKYFCAGTCKAVVSEEEYNSGKHTCGTDTCTHFGQPFEPGLQCSVCGQRVEPGKEEEHKHEEQQG